ncbi:EAL domain-containing protein [Actinoplanes sp. NEAU-A12]|uniref:EAL domain-containing protein n=1 Tax=Actinoplanes sandaracinus TaxID=3045177 RepID=A0ABT6WTT3_9ACTN|nr:EAL domain-containing protein [Actinoplanes sandaracinus]MDI6103156.1 EAL domain-containing protein [Actinoplanes sandaracinus]
MTHVEATDQGHAIPVPFEFRLHLGLSAALLVTLLAGPEWAAAPAMGLLLLLGLVAIHRGPRRHRPVDGSPWRHIRTASYFFVVCSLLRVVRDAGGLPDQLTLLPDLLTIPAYLLVGLCFSIMLRRRHDTDDDAARIDALLMGLGTAFLTWMFLIAPRVSAQLSGAQFINVLFPIIDVAVLVLALRLLLGRGARQPALWMMVLACGVLFTGDLLYCLRVALLVGVPEQLIDSSLLLMFVLLTGASLHPSMRTLTEPQQVVVRDLSRARTVSIGSMVIIPVALTALMPAGTTASNVIRAVLCVLLVLTVLIRVIRSNNSRAHAERISRRRVTHDTLTDLPNRELLTETVAGWAGRAAAERLEISLLFLDLDRFKMINDNWGHSVGDELLRAVAGRLSEQVRPGDVVSRIGGDEFVVALASPPHERLAESLAERLLAEFNRPFSLSIGDVVTSVSIGVAKSAAGAHALELIRDADTAMYKAKSNGRNVYALFDSSMHAQVQDRVRLEQALRGAVERGELAAHFQPIIDLASGELDGFEALMRWHSPVLGHVSPVEFIPIAEETGMIEEMGSWLLRESVRQLGEWIAQRGPHARPLHVSVNVAVRQLRDGSLVRLVDEALRENDLPPSALWLEITESGVMEDLETALLTLNALRTMGVTLCIDDFGTGYSSLSYLHRLPVGIVKIDRSFVSDVGENGANEPIVRAVLAMTRAMGHRVVAEGVETEAQRDWLREQGCDLVQGWLYSKADLPANLTGWIEHRAPALTEA